MYPNFQLYNAKWFLYYKFYLYIHSKRFSYALLQKCKIFEQSTKKTNQTHIKIKEKKAHTDTHTYTYNIKLKLIPTKKIALYKNFIN